MVYQVEFFLHILYIEAIVAIILKVIVHFISDFLWLVAMCVQVFLVTYAPVLWRNKYIEMCHVDIQYSVSTHYPAWLLN